MIVVVKCYYHYYFWLAFERPLTAYQLMVHAYLSFQGWLVLIEKLNLAFTQSLLLIP